MRDPYYRDTTATLYAADPRDFLAEMPDQTVDCIVTSPPPGHHPNTQDLTTTPSTVTNPPPPFTWQDCGASWPKPTGSSPTREPAGWSPATATPPTPDGTAHPPGGTPAEHITRR